MRNVKKIKLIKQETVYGARREPILKDVSPAREVFAEIQSITMNEFYSAASVGMTPNAKAIVWAFEYHGEQILEIGGQRYKVYRTYQVPTGNKMEIYYTFETGPNTAPPTVPEATT